MRDRDALENNPHITRSALEAIHGQVFGWPIGTGKSHARHTPRTKCTVATMTFGKRFGICRHGSETSSSWFSAAR